MISIQNNREWQRFCEQVLLRPELAATPAYSENVDRCANRPALDEEINGVFGSLARAALIERLMQAKTAFASVNSVADLARHPQLRRAAVATPGGTVDLVAPPVIVDRTDPVLRPVPALGEHSDAIRGEYQDNNA